MVLKLFSKQSIFSLVDILFKDMKEDYKLIEMESSEEDSDCEHGKEEEKALQEQLGIIDDEFEDPTKYGVNNDDYMGRKGVLSIERIKDIVGEIMGTCEKKMKYDIIEYIMKGVVYERKKLRESFLQEILNAQSQANFANALEVYINRRKMTIFEKKEVQENKVYDYPKYKNRFERVIQYANLDVNRTLIDFDNTENHVFPNEKALKNKNWLNRLFVLTNQGI